MADASNGYEAIAQDFIAGRNTSAIGAEIVRTWSHALPHNGTILDLGCGSGVPIAQTLVEEGFTVYGVDASISMTVAFHANFPDQKVACEAVEISSFFHRTFDAVVAWGLMFLMPVETQVAVIKKIGTVLYSEGRFLFTSPAQVCTWLDNKTGHPSVSMGAAAYKSALMKTGFSIAGEYEDQGENYYYDAVRL